MTKPNIKVLGSGCTTCETLYNKVLAVAKEIEPTTEVEYSTDISKIVELGAMSSPVFAIDDKIITAGRMPDDEEIKTAILENSNI
ncbi:MAG TPA: thioredoxin family protein [Candidatus Kaiserbacteria bacterium]|nr:thioredoxin family protein [Candidatus Kaiserbacteria bacterium]